LPGFQGLEFCKKRHATSVFLMQNIFLDIS
jgi:hypothetical protein